MRTPGKPLQQEQGPHNTPSTCSSREALQEPRLSRKALLPSPQTPPPSVLPTLASHELSAENRCPNVEMGPLLPTLGGFETPARHMAERPASEHPSGNTVMTWASPQGAPPWPPRCEKKAPQHPWPTNYSPLPPDQEPLQQGCEPQPLLAQCKLLVVSLAGSTLRADNLHSLTELPVPNLGWRRPH